MVLDLPSGRNTQLATVACIVARLAPEKENFRFMVGDIERLGLDEEDVDAGTFSAIFDDDDEPSETETDVARARPR